MTTPGKRDHIAESVEEPLSRMIIGGFYDVYNHFGYGLLECHYANALEIELTERGLRVQREYPVAVSYKGHRIGQHRLDMLIEDRVIIEIKATERIPEFARRQLRNYVALMERDLGILLHFGPKPFFYRELGGFGRGRADSAPRITGPTGPDGAGT